MNIRRAAAPPAASRRTVFAGLAGGLLLLGGATWWLTMPPTRPPAIAPPVTAGISIAVETPSAILAHDATGVTVFRVVSNPRILVIDYPNLTVQGRAMNRVAAFIEKANLSKDRVLDDATLAAEIARAGDTPESYYFGHDYRAADLRRFFATAVRDRQPLNADEEFVRRLLRQEGLLAPDAVAAVITVPRAYGDVIDRRNRLVILRHELAQGGYFTNPAYADFANRAWHQIFTEPERLAFLRFLADQGYDSDNLDLMVNEAQAFLAFTRMTVTSAVRNWACPKPRWPICADVSSRHAGGPAARSGQRARAVNRWIPSARTFDSRKVGRALGVPLISRAAATPTPRAYRPTKTWPYIRPARPPLVLAGHGGSGGHPWARSPSAADRRAPRTSGVAHPPAHVREPPAPRALRACRHTGRRCPGARRSGSR